MATGKLQTRTSVVVTDFGAVGDGTTDDTTAIQAAVDAAQEGDILVFPRGSYLISTTVTVDKRLTLEGYGAALVEDGVLSPMVLIDDAPECRVLGLSFTGSESFASYDGTSEGQNRLAIRVVDSPGCVISDVQITGKSSGVRFRDSDDCVLEDSVITGVLTSAVESGNNWSNGCFIDGSAHVTVRGCTMQDLGSGVLAGREAYGALIEGNAITNTQDNGVYVSSGTASIVQGNNITTSRGSGVKVRGSLHLVTRNHITATQLGVSVTGNGLTPDAYGYNGYGNIVSHNVIDDTQREAISSNSQDGYWGRHFVIEHNVIRNATSDGESGFAVMRYTDPFGWTIRGNVIDGFAGDYGILVVGDSGNHTTDLTIEGNIFRNGTKPGSRGILLQYVDNSRIAGNFIDLTDGIPLEVQDGSGNIVAGNRCPSGTLRVSGSAGATDNIVANNVASAFSGSFPANVFTGNMGSTANGQLIGDKKHLPGTAAPSSGTWARGDVVWNTAPSAGGSIGWVCTAGGSPGTWKAFGEIAV